jgi:hypothetical protein
MHAVYSFVGAESASFCKIYIMMRPVENNPCILIYHD